MPSSLNLSQRSLFSRWHSTFSSAGLLHPPRNKDAYGFGPDGVFSSSGCDDDEEDIFLFFAFGGAAQGVGDEEDGSEDGCGEELGDGVTAMRSTVKTDSPNSEHR